ncbi:hypothetical protein ACP4OV_015909 [Aristida adscensionis]
MVKIEDHAEDGGADADAPQDAASNPPPVLMQSRVKAEEHMSVELPQCSWLVFKGRANQPELHPWFPHEPSEKAVAVEGQPSSSYCDLRLQYIGMGFQSMLVDKVLQEHGDDDSENILNSLLHYSALQNSGPESSDSLGSLFDSDNEEKSLDSRKGINQDIKPEPDSFSEKRSYLLRTMNFSQQEVDSAFNQLGDEASLEQLVDCIVIAQLGGSSGVTNNSDATNERKAESLYGVMEQSMSLLEMGFTEEEVSSAIDSFGQGATVKVDEMADYILARRIGSSIDHKEGAPYEKLHRNYGFSVFIKSAMSVYKNGVKVESDFLGETERGYSSYHPSGPAMGYYDDDDIGRDNTRVKRVKPTVIHDRGASSSHTSNPWFMGSNIGIPIKEELEPMAPGGREKLQGDLAKPPYFLYGNVVEISRATWCQLSQFLYNVAPDFVNSQFFSALVRKEGYLHNLPTENRCAAVPKSPMTIEEALPFTRQWWPSWDTRKHIGPVTTEVEGIEQICERLERLTRDSRGVLSQERQVHIMHQCKALNLIWVGQNKLSPLEPHQVERILGYPHNHTNLFGISPSERFATLKYAFQTDTLSYLLSVLKDMYPDGIRVLSIYSGIGGAEVTLHRLGIPLKCVVSVEESRDNRRILKRWWLKTEQTGELRQLDSVRRLNTDVIEGFVNEFGGFDLIIGGNYTSCRGGTTVSTTMGLDSTLFYEFARVVKRARAAAGIH